jgi:biopolymer transport protein ExbB/TolQ
MLELVRDGFAQGGVFMWPILACAIFGAAISMERFVTVYLRAAVHAPALWSQVQRLLLDGDAEGAIRLCNGDPGAVLPRVLKAGLLMEARPDGEVRDALEEATLEVFPIVNRRLSYLPMIANVSTLLGLLGTIQGLIVAFHAVAEATAEARSSALSGGIALAMYTTFFGLLVSIPILVAHGVVAARANLILDEVDHYAMKLVNLLAARRAEVGASPGAPVLPFPR